MLCFVFDCYVSNARLACLLFDCYISNAGLLCFVFDCYVSNASSFVLCLIVTLVLRAPLFCV